VQDGEPSGNCWPQLNSRAEKSSEDRNGCGRQAYARWKNRCDTAKSETWRGQENSAAGRRKSEERTSLTAEQDNDDRRKSRAEDQRTGKLDNSGAQRSGNHESQTDLAL
jgi:hypothetical protein